MNYFAVEGRLYQWDTGRKVTLTLPYDEYASVVEFSVNNEAEALVVSVVDNVAKIPNILLQRSGSLRLWAVTIEENGRQTRRYGNLPIFPRAKPDDYVYTETEIMDYRKVAEDLAELVQRVEEIEENGVQGGGAVASVNGKTGEVYLNAADVGALPTTGGKLTGNLTVPRLISTAADADGNIYEVQLYPTANGGLYMPLRHNGAVANAMSMSQSATTFGKPVAISSGGHGGKNAAEGRQNLSLYSKEEIDEKITNTQKEIERLTEEMNDYILGVLNCLEHVAWSTPDGRQYYDALKAKYDSYNGLEPTDPPIQPGVLTARSNSLSVDDSSFKNGYVKNDGSIDTTTDYQQNFFWDKFVGCKAFLFVDENGAYVPVVHRCAAYSEDKSIITTTYYNAVTTPTATSLLGSDGAFYKLGFKQESLTVDRALVANTKMDTMCTIEDTTLDTSGEAVYSAGRIASDYIQLYDNTPILCRSHNSLFIVCLYDADKALIDRQIGVSGEHVTRIIAVPENAKYVRVCTTAGTNVYTSLEMT